MLRRATALKRICDRQRVQNAIKQKTWIRHKKKAHIVNLFNGIPT